jgi:hypothetical protein
MTRFWNNLRWVAQNLMVPMTRFWNNLRWVGQNLIVTTTRFWNNLRRVAQNLIVPMTRFWNNLRWVNQNLIVTSTDSTMFVIMCGLFEWNLICAGFKRSGLLTILNPSQVEEMT